MNIRIIAALMALSLFGINIVAGPEDAPGRPTTMPASLPKGAPPKDMQPALPPARTLNIPPQLLVAPLRDVLGTNTSAFCAPGSFFGAATIRSGSGMHCKSMPGAVIAEVMCKNLGSYNVSQCHDAAQNAQYIRDNKTYILKNDNNLQALLAEEIIQRGPSAICGFMAQFVKDAKFSTDCNSKLNSILGSIKAAAAK